MSHTPGTMAPLASLASGVNGEKFAITTSPVSSGTMQTMKRGKQRRDRQDGLDARRAQDAAMLDREHHQHDDGADDERGIDAQRQPFLEEAEVDERDLPGVDVGIRRIEDRQQIAGAEAGADRQHRRPGQPVAPQRQRRHELAVADPRRRAVHGRAARLARMQAGDLGIDEGLYESEQDGDRPHQPGRRADRRRDGAHRKQHERRHPAATKNACFQSMARRMPWPESCAMLLILCPHA